MAHSTPKLTEEEVEQLVKESTWLLNQLHEQWGGCEFACATSEPVLHRLWAERYLDA